MDDLFSEDREPLRARLRAAGYQEAISLVGTRYWITPDGKDQMREEDAMLRLEREEGSDGR